MRFFALLLIALYITGTDGIDKASLKEEAHEMFMHGYRSYMKYAYPADELMPLSCKGRHRGITPSRGDVDDALGNFSLTLIDALDTLYVVGEFEEFAGAVKLIVDNVQFDSNVIVSVFETNIRVVGGLISGHLMAERLRNQSHYLQWYTDKQLLKKAVDIADRLLPAFNTTSGIPYSRINLRHGMVDFLKRQKDTCTACGGTILLEFAALSRLTGNPIYELKAKKAMDFLWAQRHRSSDLMGTVLNVHSGDWVRRDSGIGAGIDSYYEYTLKAYILLGEENYLERFNKHYDAVMRYVSKGPFFVDVHMHRPTVATRSFMDALLAFWPGLQVLKGDIKEAIETHEMLYQVVRKHKFLPEAFTHDFQVHWAEHPLRPEFIESTYFLYRATHDEHYLEVAQEIMDSLNDNVRVACGYAGIRDIRSMTHEDRMDSFVLSETFKYLYMIFSEPEDLPLDVDQYVLTTEAHFLPLNIAFNENLPRKLIFDRKGREAVVNAEVLHANPISSSMRSLLPSQLQQIRERTKSVLEEVAILQANGGQCSKPTERLRGWAFNVDDSGHLEQLKQMGIEIQILGNGRVHLNHQAANAVNENFAKWGLQFIQEIREVSEKLAAERSTIKQDAIEVFLQLLSFPHLGKPVLLGTPALFGRSLEDYSIEAEVMFAEPFSACSPLMNAPQAKGKIIVALRGNCMFVTKAQMVEDAGGLAMVVIDNKQGTSAQTSAAFGMSGDLDNPDNISIASIFLYREEGNVLLKSAKRKMFARITMSPYDEDSVVANFLKWGPASSRIVKPVKCAIEDGFFIRIEPPGDTVTFQFRFGKVTSESDPIEHQAIVERHVDNLMDVVNFSSIENLHRFFNFMRTAAYGTLGLNIKVEKTDNILALLKDIKLHHEPEDLFRLLPGDITRVKCQPDGEYMACNVVP